MSSLNARRGATKTKPRRSKVWKAQPQGWYVEPESCTEALLAVEPFAGECWDPACGGGNVIRPLLRAGLHAYGTDLVPRVPADTSWFARSIDFLGDAPPYFRPENIVTNPPFGAGVTAEAFIRRALDVATDKVAVFVNARFLSGDGRAAGLYADFPPARVWMVTPRPSCPPGDHLTAGGKAEGGQADYAWLVWQRDLAGGPTHFGWARRPRA